MQNFFPKFIFDSFSGTNWTFSINNIIRRNWKEVYESNYSFLFDLFYLNIENLLCAINYFITEKKEVDIKREKV